MVLWQSGPMQEPAKLYNHGFESRRYLHSLYLQYITIILFTRWLRFFLIMDWIVPFLYYVLAMSNIVRLYLLIINIITFIVWGIDKYKANNSHFRISESKLLWLSALGGRVGGYIGMKTFRHKTIKMSFLKKYAAIVIIYVIAIILTLRYY